MNISVIICCMIIINNNLCMWWATVYNFSYSTQPKISYYHQWLPFFDFNIHIYEDIYIIIGAYVVINESLIGMGDYDYVFNE